MVHISDIPTPIILLTGKEDFFTGLNDNGGAGLIVCKKQEGEKPKVSSDIPQKDWELILAFDEPEHIEELITHLQSALKDLEDLRTEEKLKELKDVG